MRQGSNTLIRMLITLVLLNAGIGNVAFATDSMMHACDHHTSTNMVMAMDHHANNNAMNSHDCCQTSEASCNSSANCPANNHCVQWSNYLFGDISKPIDNLAKCNIAPPSFSLSHYRGRYLETELRPPRV